MLSRHRSTVIEVVRSDDPVMVAWVTARLADAGIVAHVFDAHTSMLYAGAVAALRTRVVVDDADAAAAFKILAEARLLASGR